MSVAELKERHAAATETVSALRERLRQKRLSLLDTDGVEFLEFLGFCFQCVYVLCVLVLGVAQICLFVWWRILQWRGTRGRRAGHR